MTVWYNALLNVRLTPLCLLYILMAGWIRQSIAVDAYVIGCKWVKQKVSTMCHGWMLTMLFCWNFCYNKNYAHCEPASVQPSNSNSSNSILGPQKDIKWLGTNENMFMIQLDESWMGWWQGLRKFLRKFNENWKYIPNYMFEVNWMKKPKQKQKLKMTFAKDL